MSAPHVTIHEAGPGYDPPPGMHWDDRERMRLFFSNAAEQPGLRQLSIELDPEWVREFGRWYHRFMTSSEAP
jgi:hypothetical protein